MTLPHELSVGPGPRLGACPACLRQALCGPCGSAGTFPLLHNTAGLGVIPRNLKESLGPFQAIETSPVYFMYLV